MKEFKGTPGRWDVGMNGEILSDAGYIVMGTDLIHGNEHDLDLASSAPELLSALQKIVESGRVLPHLKIESQWAIAKALGESQ